MLQPTSVFNYSTGPMLGMFSDGTQVGDALCCNDKYYYSMNTEIYPYRTGEIKIVSNVSCYFTAVNFFFSIHGINKSLHV